MTECIQEAFGFTGHFSRRVEASFTAGRVSSDGGALLLREVDRRIGLIDRLAACFTDRRSRRRVEHALPEMLAQRVYGLALGYEDLNDHEQMRSDPLLALLAGRREPDRPLAGKSTLNRLEFSGRSERYHKIGYAPEALDKLPFAKTRRAPKQERRTAIARHSNPNLTKTTSRPTVTQTTPYPHKKSKHLCPGEICGLEPAQTESPKGTHELAPGKRLS